MFERGFPVYLAKELHNVLGVISAKTYNGISKVSVDRDYNNETELLDGSRISFPYRIYFEDEEGAVERLAIREEKLIYHCIFTRHCDGYVREKHLQAMLELELEEWCFPYILMLSGEYVVDIVEVIYEHFKERDNSLFQAYCINNLHMFRYCHSRMISYWNEFYRGISPRIKNYVGRFLFRDCFDYKKYYDRLEDFKK